MSGRVFPWCVCCLKMLGNVGGSGLNAVDINFDGGQSVGRNEPRTHPCVYTHLICGEGTCRGGGEHGLLCVL